MREASLILRWDCTLACNWSGVQRVKCDEYSQISVTNICHNSVDPLSVGSRERIPQVTVLRSYNHCHHSSHCEHVNITEAYKRKESEGLLWVSEFYYQAPNHIHQLTRQSSVYNNTLYNLCNYTHYIIGHAVSTLHLNMGGYLLAGLIQWNTTIFNKHGTIEFNIPTSLVVWSMVRCKGPVNVIMIINLLLIAKFNY